MVAAGTVLSLAPSGPISLPQHATQYTTT